MCLQIGRLQHVQGGGGGGRDAMMMQSVPKENDILDLSQGKEQTMHFTCDPSH